MTPTQRTRLLGVLVALIAVGVATVLRLAISPLVGSSAPFTIFLLAVVVSAWSGGFWPGAVATVLGLVIGDLLFIEPKGTIVMLEPEHAIRSFSYLLVGLSISAVSEQWHRARRRDRVHALQLEHEMAERLKLVDELREAKQTLEAMVAAAPVPIVVIDPDTTVRLWNKAAEKVFGWRAEEVLGQRIPIIPEAKTGECHAALDAMARGESIGPMLTQRQRKDGALVDVELSAAPLHGSTGAPGRMVALLQDVSERLGAQAALAASEERLRESNQRKDEFLATLAHELRNPLAPIRTSLHVMALAGDTYATDQARATIDRQLAQMVRLIDDLLDVSRITSGKIELRREIVELADVIQSAVETSRPVIDERGHQLVVRMPSESLVVDADLTRLAQVFGNLLRNAAKYTERGGRIELSAERHGSQVVVHVRDQGIGIAPEMLPRIFELFIQAGRTPDGAHEGGIGIGLTLVKRLTELHGGTVVARSEGLGHGSEFEVRLPLSRRTVAPPPPRREAPLGGSIRRKILVVDDSDDAAASLSTLLELMGNETRIAHDGVEAVAVAAEFHPDVVLLDLGMPRMSGYEACRRMREAPGGTKMTVIAVTGWGQQEDRARTREAGFDHHMVKPVDPRALAELLDGLETRTRLAARP